MVESTVEISQNFVAFSEYMNFICSHLSYHVSLKNIYWLVEIVHIDDAIHV